MWWLLGAAIWAVLLVVILALCRVAANADQAASKAFAAMERSERQKLYTLAIEGRDTAA
jgi:hypothetical protein